MRQLSLVIAAHPNTPPIFEWREYLPSDQQDGLLKATQKIGLGLGTPKTSQCRALAASCIHRQPSQLQTSIQQPFVAHVVRQRFAISTHSCCIYRNKCCLLSSHILASSSIEHPDSSIMMIESLSAPAREPIGPMA